MPDDTPAMVLLLVWTVVDRATERRAARGTAKPSQRADLPAASIELVVADARICKLSVKLCGELPLPCSGTDQPVVSVEVDTNVAPMATHAVVLLLTVKRARAPREADRIAGFRRGARVAGHVIASDSKRAVEMD